MAPPPFANENNDQYWRQQQSQADAGPFNGTLGGYWSVRRSDICEHLGLPSSHTHQSHSHADAPGRQQLPPSVNSLQGYRASSQSSTSFAAGTGNVYGYPSGNAAYGTAFANNGDDQLFAHTGYATLTPVRNAFEHYGPLQTNARGNAPASSEGSKRAISRAGSTSRREPSPRYACDVFGCTETFTRAFDVKRHKGTAHGQGSRVYVCNADGCDFEEFRRDKACQHVREKSHGSFSVVDVDDELHEGEAESDSEAEDESGAE